MHFERNDPHILARRLAEYVRPKASAKELARMIGSSVRTAENIRQGHWPIARHWLGLWQAFGEDLVEAVFHPDRAVARLEQEVRQLETEAARKRRELLTLEGIGVGGAEARVGPDRRPPFVGERVRSYAPSASD